MIVSFSAAADAEYRSALAWLAREAGARVAEDFDSEFWRAITLLKSRPHIGAPALAASRRLNLRRFRYAIMYRIDGETIRVLAVAHQHRRPGYWAGRR